MAATRGWTTRTLTGGGPSRRRADRRRVGVLWTELALRCVLVVMFATAVWLTTPTGVTGGGLLAIVPALVYLPVTAALGRHPVAGRRALPQLVVAAADVALGATGAALVPEWRVPVLFLFLALVVTTTISDGGRRGVVVSVLTTLAAGTLVLAGGTRDTVTVVALLPFVACAFALPVLISQLVTEHRRHAEHLMRLHRSLTSIVATPDLEGTFDAITGTAREAVRASLVTVLTLDDTGTSLTARAVTAPGMRVPALAVDTIELAGDVPAWSPLQLAARTGRPVVVSATASETRFGPWAGEAIAAGVTAMVSVPLRAGEAVIGTLNAYWSGEGRPSRDDVDLLSAYAEGASLSILRAHAFEQERRAAAALRDAERGRAEFTASLAHELRTPLTTVRGFIETMLLREELLEPDDRRHMLEISRRNAVDLTYRIAALLEHSKLDGDHVRVDRRVQLLGPALGDALENCHGLLSAHRLVVEVPDGLLVEVDEVALDHIVANLVSNAVKYAAEGTPVTVRAEVLDEDTVLVSVSDRGIGIPPAELPRVFDRFYRGGDQAGRSGTGIGLAIVKRYVELSGGRIWVESVPGHGTAFRFTLPFVGAGRGVPDGGTTAGGDGHGARVLAGHGPGAAASD